MTCDERVDLPLEEPLRLPDLVAGLRAASAACRDRWISEGIDLAGYTTVESAGDVDELRRALGYERITLVGGSYGSHLALAVMRQYPASVARVVLHGVEGLDHTWDDPAGRLAAYERHAAAAEASGRFSARIPPGGLLGALRTVLERLDREPVLVTVETDGIERQVVVDGTLVRMISGYQAGQRNRPWLWPEFILGMYEGDYSLPAQAAIDVRRFPIDDPMHYMMDCASGISGSREERYRSDPAVELLGEINWEYERLCDVWGAPDLGAEFRAPLESSIPTVIVHGTWDTSTPIENAREVVSTLENGQLIEVTTGNHGGLYNLYSRWPPIHDLLGAFLKGEDVRFPSVVDLPVEFAAPARDGE
jgi:pimeloyl-ACP methyl ester carboxylesterase